MALEVVPAPDAGVWRVARAPDPLALGSPVPPGQLDNPNTGNRFDSPTGGYRTRYFATTLDGCYGETLARFRPDARLAELAHEEGFMDVGEVPADWRHRRVAIRTRFVPAAQHPAEIRFLDVESARTRSVLRRQLARILALYGYDDLDVPTVRGRDRRVTRWIGEWAHRQQDEDGAPLYAGIRYLSRLNTEWECWAVFDRVGVEVIARAAVMRDSAALRRIASLYGITVF